MKTKRTERGFDRIEFVDEYDKQCSLQKSSLATKACVWFGCDEIGLKKFTPGEGWTDVHLRQDGPYGISHIANTRMHLTRAQVKKLLPYLQKFVETGEINFHKTEEKLKMENHKQIKGYRELNEVEIALINRIKEHGVVLQSLIDDLGKSERETKADPRWLAIGKTHLQEGLMALTRSVAKPDFF